MWVEAIIFERCINLFKERNWLKKYNYRNIHFHKVMLTWKKGMKADTIERGTCERMHFNELKWSFLISLMWSFINILWRYPAVAFDNKSVLCEVCLEICWSVKCYAKIMYWITLFYRIQTPTQSVMIPEKCAINIRIHISWWILWGAFNTLRPARHNW